MKKIFFIIFLMIIIITVFATSTFTGGIEDYYFIISIGIDKGKTKDILLSLQISSSENSSSGSSDTSQSTEFKIYSVETDTIEQGLSILNNYLNKQINLSHCSTIIISEELAKDGIQKYINTLSNNTELRHSAKIIISSAKATDILNFVSNSGGSFTARLYDYLTNTTEYTGFTIDSTFGKFFQALDNDKMNPYGIYAAIDSSNETIQSDGIAIFKGDYMVGHVNNIDSIMHLLLTNKIEFANLSISNPFEHNSFVDIELSNYKHSKFKVNIINNTPFIEIDLYPEGSILSSGNSFNFIDNTNIKKLEDSMNAYVENQTKEYLYKLSKEYNSDIIGFEDYFDKKFYTKKESYNYNFQKIFKDAFYKINVYSRIDSSNLFNKE